jgi:hypothetical protein
VGKRDIFTGVNSIKFNQRRDGYEGYIIIAAKKGYKDILMSTILGTIEEIIWGQSSIYSLEEWLCMNQSEY